MWSMLAIIYNVGYIFVKKNIWYLEVLATKTFIKTITKIFKTTIFCVHKFSAFEKENSKCKAQKQKLSAFFTISMMRSRWNIALKKRMLFEMLFEGKKYNLCLYKDKNFFFCLFWNISDKKLRLTYFIIFELLFVFGSFLCFVSFLCAICSNLRKKLSSDKLPKNICTFNYVWKKLYI